jgi:cytochrome c peroxidase
MGRRARSARPADRLAHRRHAGDSRLALRLSLLLAVAALHGVALAADRSLPPGFDPPWIPPDNPQTPEKVLLGERLFTDPRLSVTGRYSCASCHDAARAFTDGRARAVGANGDTLRRNAMPLANVAWNAAYTWADPSVRTLEAQLLVPLMGEHPIEMGLKGREALVLDSFRQDAGLREAFDAAFPDDRGDAITLLNLAKALAAYERSLVFADSPFDRYVYRDDRKALSAQARAGMALFFSERTRCARCHAGINFAGPARTAKSPDVAPVFANTGLYDVDGRGGYPPEDRGLQIATGRAEDNGRFRVPTLRNVALTAPYMHDGSIATLGEVIEHYDRGGRARQGDRPAPLRDPLIRPLHLTAAEKAALEAFLRSLDSPALEARVRP